MSAKKVTVIGDVTAAYELEVVVDKGEKKLNKVIHLTQSVSGGCPTKLELVALVEFNSSEPAN